MLHEYRKTALIEAEQFDGSNEMAEKYGLKKFGWRGFVREYGVNDFELGQKPLSAYYWHTGEPEPTFHEYKHVDGIIKHVKTTYKKLPF